MNSKNLARVRSYNSARPRIEPLEDRRLLAACFVVRLGDFGAGNSMGAFARGDLRYCIAHVNANPGPDTIDINVTGTINLTGPLPDLASDMDILGPGSTALTVRRNTGGNYRIFTVLAGAEVRISGLTANNGNLAGGQGGGIHNQGTLTLIGTKINGNTAGSGGGIYNSGSLLVQDSGVSNNFAISGGGISNSNTGSLSIVNSSIVQNLLYVQGGSGYSSAWVNGGGIYNLGTTMIQSSSVANNTALAIAYWADSYGGGIYTSGPMTIANSTISGNVAEASATGDSEPIAYGGGIHNQSMTVTIDNCTIANNKVSTGDYGGGSGINVWGSAFIMHSTIANNSYREGIRIGGQLTLRNSIVADNGGFPNNGSNDLKGTIASSGYNLIGSSSGGSGYVPSDILDVDPMLASLASNGGPTLTMPLLPGSPAIDSGTNQGAPEWDQRGPGFPRIVNGTIDRGAFEVQATGAALSNDYLTVLITAHFSANDSVWRN